MFSSATLVVGRYHATNIACCNLLSRSVAIFFCLLCTALRAALVHAFMLTMFFGQCFKTVVWVAERGRRHGLTGQQLCLEWYYYWGHICYTGIPTVFTFRFWFFCTKVESWNCWKCMSDENWLLSMDFNNVFCLVRVCVCVHVKIKVTLSLRFFWFVHNFVRFLAKWCSSSWVCWSGSASFKGVRVIKSGFG